MILLSESLKKTAAIAEGYNLGRLIFEDDVVFIEDEKTERYISVESLEVIVLNGNEWYKVQDEDYKKITPEGWPLLGGFLCKYK